MVTVVDRPLGVVVEPDGDLLELGLLRDVTVEVTQDETVGAALVRSEVGANR